jgi:hypothetical protein
MFFDPERYWGTPVSERAHVTLGWNDSVLGGSDLEVIAQF